MYIDHQFEKKTNIDKLGKKFFGQVNIYGKFLKAVYKSFVFSRSYLDEYIFVIYKYFIYMCCILYCVPSVTLTRHYVNNCIFV